MKKRKNDFNENTQENTLPKKVKYTLPTTEQCNALFDAVKENKMDVLISIVNSGNFEIADVIRPKDITQPKLRYDFLGTKPENSLLTYALLLKRDDMVKFLVGARIESGLYSGLQGNFQALALFLVGQHKKITSEHGGSEEEKSTSLPALYPALRELGKTQEGKSLASMRLVNKQFRETGSFLSFPNGNISRDIGRMFSSFALGLSHVETVELNKAIKEISASHHLLNPVKEGQDPSKRKHSLGNWRDKANLTDLSDSGRCSK